MLEVVKAKVLFFFFFFRIKQQDYQTFISRKSQKRQTLIVSLTDQNRLELQEIQKQKEDLLKVYEERKGGTCTYVHTTSQCTNVINL